VAPVSAETPAALQVPEDLRGAWRDVLTGDPLELVASAAVGGMLSEPFGLALLERA